MKHEKICKNCDYWSSRNYTKDFRGVRYGRCKGIDCFSERIQLVKEKEGYIDTMETSFCSEYTDKIKKVELARSYRQLENLRALVKEGKINER